MLNRIVHKLKRRWIRLWYQPIRVLVFHHVSDVYDELLCGKEDWTQLNQFEHNIEHLSQVCTFISLSEACEKLQHDWFRCRKYAVLTTDDGLASVLNVLPWLEEKGIPLTLFVNTRFMSRDMLKLISIERLKKIAPDVDVYSLAQKTYLSEEQIFALKSPLVEIGLHGHEHLNVQLITEEQFEADCTKEEAILHSHTRYVSAYAFPWGKSTEASLQYLQNQGIVPVVVDGNKNYVWNGYVSRESIDNVKMDAK